MKRIPALVFAVLCVLALTLGVVAASAAPSRTFINDFERVGDDTPSGDWWTDPPATSTRTPSGAAATYGSGVASAHGRWHVRMSPNMVCPKSPAGPMCFGAFTRFGKTVSYNPNFPSGGYVTEIDIYLDVPWMAQMPATRFDTRFDWTSAINDASGMHLSDFIFNAGTPLLPTETMTNPGYYVNASTNGNRSGAFPQNTCPNPATPPNYCRTPVKIEQSGWYTFRHYFHKVTIGAINYLATDMSIRRHNAVVASWTIYTQETVRGFGGDRYGWFVINEIQDLAADCLALHPPGISHPGLGAPCRFNRREDDEGGGRCDRNGDSDQAENDELDRMNRTRSAALLPPLTMNASSSTSARGHSCDQHQHGDFGERGSDGSMSADRMHAAGVPFTVNAENNAVVESPLGSEAISLIQSDLVGDALATANVLNPAFTQVGIGVVYLDGVMYLTEDFTG